MKGKECYFGSTTIEKRSSGKEVLNVGDYFGDCNISVYDGEIADNEDSPEIVVITIKESDEAKDVEREIFVHKKDCLQISAFLLGIHTEYANKVNGLEFECYSDEINRNAKEVKV